MDVLGFAQFKTAYQKLANNLASECGGHFTHADFLKAIEVVYNQAFSQEHIARHLKSLEHGQSIVIPSPLIRLHPELGFPHVGQQPFCQHHL